jgi:hypothetical protein
MEDEKEYDPGEMEDMLQKAISEAVSEMHIQGTGFVRTYMLRDSSVVSESVDIADIMETLE